MEFERVSPESVGISSKDVLHVLDLLEGAPGPVPGVAVSAKKGRSVPNGLMLSRNGKVFAEGWWAPYAKNIPHELYSMTKTYTVTALGIAYTEGLIRSLDDAVLDYFPEFRYEGMDPRNEKIRIRHLLTMSSGKPEIRSLADDWARHFFTIPITREPGEWYEYSCEDTHMIMALVQKVTGERMDRYLTEKLFSKIGIDSERVIWAYLDEGSPVGCGGLHATLEDSLRLGELYRNGGVWMGERILDARFAAEAVTTQILQLSHSDPIAKDYAKPGLIPGYGYQIWTDYTGIPGEFCIHGAIGQVCIVTPETGISISYQQTGAGIGSDRTAICDAAGFLSSAAADAPLPEDPEMLEHLRKRLATLSLGAPASSRPGPRAAEISGKHYVIRESGLTFRKAGWNHIADSNVILPERGMEWMEFEFPSPEVLKIRFLEDGCVREITAGLDGMSRLNDYPFCKMPRVNQALFDASWPEENRLRVCARWVQTSFYIQMDFTFSTDRFTAGIHYVTGDFDLHPMRDRTVTGDLCL